jgi:rod shape determining protein RodA
MEQTWTEKKNKITEFRKKFDTGLLLSAIALSVFSCILIYSIVKNEILSNVGMSYFTTQVAATVLGIIALIVVSAIDYKKLSKFWFLMVPVAVILILLTFTSLGVTIEGVDDRGWLDFGFIQFQPSEILKLVFLITFSLHLSKDRENMNKPLHMLLIVIHAMIPVGLVLLQGDDGTALIFIFMFAAMLLTSDVSWKYILAAVILIPIAAFVFWQFFIGDVQKERILILFNPGTDPTGLEYQQNLSLAALANGKMFGKGLFSDEFISLPEIYNDFIFAHVGQTTGFVGCVIVLCVVAYMLLRILIDSHKAKDSQGMILCSGVFGMFLCHYFFNLGMVLKVTPVIGVPLPFLSAGGTAIVSMYMALGLVISTYTHNEKKRRFFYDSESYDY